MAEKISHLPANIGLPTPDGVGIDLAAPKEINLRGKKAIVTGGSRDIGRAIVEALTAEGVDVVFSFHDKEKRANKVLEAVDGNLGSAKALQADISTPVGRQHFFETATSQLGGSIDFLILSTSGPTAALNEEASMQMVDLAIPHLNRGGSVIRLQSIPAKYDAQLKDLNLMEAVPEYYDVATHKYLDMKALRGRQEELAGIGVNLIEVAPPFVKGTSNVTLFEMAARRRTDGKQTAEQMHEVLTAKLGLPNIVSAEQVGEKIAKLLKTADLPKGFTELFAENLIDTQTVLENWYGTDQVYVNTFERLADLGEQRRGVGRAIVSKEQTEKTGELKINPSLISPWDLPRLLVSPEHATGHFKEESGLPRILPGHKQIRAAVEAISFEKGSRLRIASLEHAKFEKPVVADANTNLVINPIKNENGSYDVEIVRESDGARTALIEGLRVVPTDEPDENALWEDQILEGAAQTIGVTHLGEVDPDTMPLFLEIGPTTFFPHPRARAGEGISYSAVSEKLGKREFGGTVIVASDDKIMAEITGLKAMVIKRGVIDRMLAS